MKWSQIPKITPNYVLELVVIWNGLRFSKLHETVDGYLSFPGMALDLHREPWTRQPQNLSKQNMLR